MLTATPAMMWCPRKLRLQDSPLSPSKPPLQELFTLQHNLIPAQDPTTSKPLLQQFSSLLIAVKSLSQYPIHLPIPYETHITANHVISTGFQGMNPNFNPGNFGFNQNQGGGGGAGGQQGGNPHGAKRPRPE